jgi:SIR2-like domain
VVPVTKGSRVTILTGAGLCKHVGLPTSVELAASLRKALRAACDIEGGALHAGPRDRPALLLATYRFLNGGIRFQQGILNGDPDEPVNIEQIAVAAQELQNRAKNPISPYSSGWHDRLVELERGAPELLSTFVDYIYCQLEHWLRLDEERKGRLSYIRNLVEICNDGYGVDIFSLNYDLCIETALKCYAKKVFVNGFTEEGGWRPETLERDSLIRLFKLHGSLDWVEDQAYGLCSLQYPRHKSAENVEGDNVRPLLIFGTTHKLSAREPFLSLAYAFSRAVLKTAVLGVIGYSFGDDYVNQMIRQGIERNPKLRVLVVGPHADEQVDGTPFLQGRQPRVVGMKARAEEALSEGRFLNAVRDLLERSSDEEPFTD